MVSNCMRSPVARCLHLIMGTGAKISLVVAISFDFLRPLQIPSKTRLLVLFAAIVINSGLPFVDDRSGESMSIL